MVLGVDVNDDIPIKFEKSFSGEQRSWTESSESFQFISNGSASNCTGNLCPMGN